MFFKDKTVLIIGGTGTIGKNLLRQILLDEPKLITILSRDEYKQFNMEKELGRKENVRFLIGDVRDYDRLLEVMRDCDYVFHAAAMKHVPSCEANPYEAVFTNVIGTHNVIKAGIENNVKKIVMTSSDKAISPKNTYGATKLILEKLIQATVYNKRNNTKFAIVRFGNVLGSRGSVIPLFVNQILNKKKIEVTNFDMTRFMMTQQQATNLTMKALKEANGGEIFVLKMPVISLKDLVAVVIEEMCKKYDLNRSDITVEETGLRPGEKMYEELMTYEESLIALEQKDMYIIPAIFKTENDYSDAIKAKPGMYSSHDQNPISVEEVRKIIKSENLI